MFIGGKFDKVVWFGISTRVAVNSVKVGGSVAVLFAVVVHYACNKGFIFVGGNAVNVEVLTVKAINVRRILFYWRKFTGI